MTLTPPEIVFNLAPGQNRLFVTLAQALIDELIRLGASGRVAWDEYPYPDRGRVIVLLSPHEYTCLTAFRPPPAMLKRCIGITAMQSTVPQFGESIELARDLGALFDINRGAIREYARLGIEAQHLPLGHTGSWDRFDHAERDIDVLFTGSYTDRRGRAIAGYADILERYRCHIEFWDDSGVAVSGPPDRRHDSIKRELFARAKVFLSMRGVAEPCFERLHVLEAISAGCVVVAEHSSDNKPLVPGEDFLSGGLERLGLLCSAVVDDPALRERIRRAGYEKLVRDSPMRRAAQALIEAATAIDQEPLSRAGLGVARIDYLQAKRGRRPKSEFQPPQTDLSPAARSALRTLKSLTLSVMALRRRIDVLEQLVRTGGDAQVGPVVKHETSAWALSAPRSVTVIVPLYNHASDVRAALASVLSSDVSDWEMVIVDDASGDHGADVVSEFLDQHDDRAMRLVQHPVNLGLPHARNTGAAHSTAELLLMLDADNGLRAGAIRKLRAALEQDTDASFAYGIIERIGADGPQGLVSAFPWNPQRLRIGNYIDALAMIRRDALLALRGYRSDPRIHGWEDYDLWVRLAEAGLRGAFVPEMIARYQVSHSSMVSVTNIAVTDAYASIAQQAPKLMAGLRIPV